ncbi:Methyltransferase domain-containing protein [Variovorax sp. NFACC28]|nr:Methyltransferase domain-containing protein [Variovorax sp. NFACC28]SEG85079.1 Methyltransferase domain-containing protein [Variovorax sp. NFACC29]SFD19350.1 Methyltransferase domain-containing protein [Variovorax sp. NFACC26]SFG26553.1 Methyltransferase domain-containing protein [Variovorax sp. NFACC27]
MHQSKRATARAHESFRAPANHHANAQCETAKRSFLRIRDSLRYAVRSNYPDRPLMLKNIAKKMLRPLWARARHRIEHIVHSQTVPIWQHSAELADRLTLIEARLASTDECSMSTPAHSVLSNHHDQVDSSMICSVCGGREFTGRKILWQGLIDEWQLSPDEADYVDRQQGEQCVACGSNLRSIALADAIRSCMGLRGTLREVARMPNTSPLRILELNEAGTLTSTLQQFAGYVFGKYPEVDMHAMPYPDNSFDIVIHSDTLEHVPNPVHGLEECRRILKPGGALCFTVPVIVGRMTRDRSGLQKSFHGDPATATADLVVQTEFGADAWTFIMQAGFRKVTTHALAYPAATAFSAFKI